MPFAKLRDMRRRLAILLAALLAGCAPPSAERETVLRLANWGGAGSDSEYDRLIQSIYREFEAANPGVRVRVENNPDGYVQKMILSFIAKAEPDLMILDASSAAIFINNGVLTDLTPLIENDPEFRLDDFYQNVVDIARRENSLYAIPQDFTPMVMYYNKRLFDAAGVPYPQAGWNFDDFLQTAKLLTKPEVDQYGFVFANWMPGWVMWLWNNGGEVLTVDGERAGDVLDSDANVKTVEFLRDLIGKHKVAPSLSQAAALGVDPFANGQAAMTVSGHWAMVGYANAPKGEDGKPKISWEDLGVAPLPSILPKSQTVMYETGFSIGRNSKNKELAWKFIKFMTSRSVQSRYHSSGVAVSARKDVALERAAKAGLPVEEQFIALIEGCRAPWGAKVEGYEFVEKTGAGAMDSILNGTDARTALRRAADRIDREFANR